jgi:hypothetical protein
MMYTQFYLQHLFSDKEDSGNRNIFYSKEKRKKVTVIVSTEHYKCQKYLTSKSILNEREQTISKVSSEERGELSK